MFLLRSFAHFELIELNFGFTTGEHFVK